MLAELWTAPSGQPLHEKRGSRRRPLTGTLTLTPTPPSPTGEPFHKKRAVAILFAAATGKLDVTALTKHTRINIKGVTSLAALRAYCASGKVVARAGNC